MKPNTPRTQTDGVPKLGAKAPQGATANSKGHVGIFIVQEKHSDICVLKSTSSRQFIVSTLDHCPFNDICLCWGGFSVVAVMKKQASG